MGQQGAEPGACPARGDIASKMGFLLGIINLSINFLLGWWALNYWDDRINLALKSTP